MIKYKVCILLCFALFICNFLLATTEESGSHLPRVSVNVTSTAADYMLASLENIKNFGYQEYQMRREVIDGAWTGNYLVEFVWRESKNKFYCDWTQTNKDNDKIFQQFAFDGERMYILDPDTSSTLYIKSGYDPARVHLKADEFLLTPFRFPLRYVSQEQNAYPSIEYLTDSFNYLSLLDKCDGVEIHDHLRNGVAFIEVAFRGLLNPVTKEHENMKIYFNKESDMFPVSYEVTTSDNRSIMKYEVIELAKIAAENGTRQIWYPRVAEAKYYNYRNVHVGANHAPAAVYRYSISDLLISLTHPDRIDLSSFSIDPIGVDRIFDEDSNQVIMIPR